jgi:cytochrome c oxidase subunit I+III
LHTGLGVIFASFGAWRQHAGYVSARRTLDLRIGKLWHDYTALSVLAGVGLVLLLPLLIGFNIPSGEQP